MLSAVNDKRFERGWFTNSDSEDETDDQGDDDTCDGDDCCDGDDDEAPLEELTIYCQEFKHPIINGVVGISTPKL